MANCPAFVGFRLIEGFLHKIECPLEALKCESHDLVADFLQFDHWSRHKDIVHENIETPERPCHSGEHCSIRGAIGSVCGASHSGMSVRAPSPSSVYWRQVARTNKLRSDAGLTQGVRPLIELLSSN